MATFERYFLEDPETHRSREEPLLQAVGERGGGGSYPGGVRAARRRAYIVNGHVPVKSKSGRIRSGAGKVLVIDGAFQKPTRRRPESPVTR